MPGIVVGEISRNMRGSLGGTIILATCFAVCVAVCRPGLNGRNDWYQCEGLNEISVRERTCSIFLFFFFFLRSCPIIWKNWKKKKKKEFSFDNSCFISNFVRFFYFDAVKFDRDRVNFSRISFLPVRRGSLNRNFRFNPFEII